ncbi:MAG: aspartyl protease family protein [Bacteroidia bacterium]|nr:aspartyl protease family protein [Bacteroidia bacterium]
MHIPRVLGLAVLWLAASSPLLAQKPPKNDPTPYCVSEGFTVTLPLAYQARHLYTEGTLRGRPQRWVFDTGAPMVITPALAAEMGYAELKSIEVTDASGQTRTQRRVLIDTLRLGTAVFVNLPAVVADFTSSAELACLFEGAAGILGIEPLKGLSVAIDYRAGQLTLTDQPAALPQAANARRAPYKPNASGTPVVELRVGGKKATSVKLDTGSGGGLDLSSPLRGKLVGRGHPYAGVGATGRVSGGLFGSVELATYTTQLDNLALGGVPIGNRLVRFEGEATSHLVGNTVLSEFRVTVHTATQEVEFAPYGPLPSAALTLPGYGVIVTFDAGKVQVVGLYENSPAQEAGLRVGAYFQVINGQDVSRLSLTDYCTLWQGWDDLPDRLPVIVNQNGLDQPLTLVRKDLLTR